MLFKNFEVRPYKDINGKVVEDKYELVKWREKDSRGKPHCFVVGFLEYNAKEPCWNFRGCGLRYQEHYESGLNEFILKYVDILNLQKKYFNADMKEFYEHY